MSEIMDLVIRGGTVIDGTGAPGQEADVAISDGQIIEVGQVAALGREEIDASDRIVTPGFVDVHTHYDAQVTWANQILPSSVNGVTTVLIGNCGVGSLFGRCAFGSGCIFFTSISVKQIIHALSTNASLRFFS